MFEKAWLWVMLVSLAISLIISWRTQLKDKSICFRTIGLVSGSVIGRGVVFFILISAPLFHQPRLEAGLVFPIMGAVIGFLGIVLVFLATRELSQTSFSGLQGIPKKVTTTGPYRFIRHPATIGFVAVYLGWCFAWEAVYALYSVPVLALILVLETFWEEKNLVRELGKDYLDYQQKVGMFFPKRKLQ